jgi:hypothetical protein
MDFILPVKVFAAKTPINHFLGLLWRLWSMHPGVPKNERPGNPGDRKG